MNLHIKGGYYSDNYVMLITCTFLDVTPAIHEKEERKQETSTKHPTIWITRTSFPVMSMKNLNLIIIQSLIHWTKAAFMIDEKNKTKEGLQLQLK